jgi:hypothetical protein
MPKKNNRPSQAEADPQARTRQSESPDLDITASGNEEISDVNQLNAFGGDRSADQPAVASERTDALSVEGHGEKLSDDSSNENQSVEAVADEQTGDNNESKYNS